MYEFKEPIKAANGAFFYDFQPSQMIRFCGNCGSLVLEQFIHKHIKKCKLTKRG